jgi:hypothetical protein
VNKLLTRHYVHPIGDVISSAHAYERTKRCTLVSRLSKGMARGLQLVLLVAALCCW